MTGRGLRIAAWPARRNESDNPYNALLSDALERAGASVDELDAGTRPGRHDVWLVHWPDDPLHDPHRVRGRLRSVAFLAAIARAQRRGTRLVWVVHNLAPHDAALGRFARWYLARFVRRVDGAIHLSEAGRQEAESEIVRLADIPGVVIPHGHYRGAYGPQLSKTAARRAAGVAEDGVVLSFVGQVRGYKGIGELARAFAGVARDDARLVVAGENRDDREAAALRELASRDPRMTVVLRRHSPGDLGALVQASDAVVLPYRTVLNSGTAILALSYGRPVIVPDTRVFAELATTVGARWVRTTAVPLTTAALSQLVDELASDRAEDPPDLERLDWGPIAESTVEFLAQLGR